MMISIEVRDTPFQPYQVLDEFVRNHQELSAACGATSVFIGTMRDFNEGETVRAMWLEHYPGMTEMELQRIVQAAADSHGFHSALVIHRVGALAPADAIVLVAVWSPHRRAALEATAEIIETLKHRAPFWKKETLEEGARWVECNTAGR